MAISFSLSGTDCPDSHFDIDRIRNQIEMLSDKRNTILRVNRAAKTAMDVFRDILQKEKLERNDLELIIIKIKVYEEHLEILLKADVDALIRCGAVEMAANFDTGIRDSISVTLVQSATKQKDKVLDINVISDGDPSKTTLALWQVFSFAMLGLPKRNRWDGTY